ncbi:hypothetical protein L1049_014959 [Liquidambar formosana]|uniref:DUF7026 domain-containing protein n=1 Tax=Liquidambar formosana TaxID=63359 RepID=A0AAP0RWR8_LIQFO
MAIRVNLFSLKIAPKTFKFQSHPLPFITLLSTRTQTNISCTNSISDAELSSDLASEMAKINTSLVQREEAMKKSRQLLFTELCQYLDMRDEEVRKKWMKMDEEEKWVLVKGFVSEWGVNFHPLSAKSVKEMVEEYLGEENLSPQSSPSLGFSDLGRILGFSPN